MSSSNSPKLKYMILPAAVFLITAVPALAEGPRPPSSMSNPFISLMVIVIFFLAVIIGLLAKLVIGTGGLFVERFKEQTQATKTSNIEKTASVAAATVAFLLLSVKLNAQNAATGTTPTVNTSGISDSAYYLLYTVVGIELLIIGVLLYMLRVFTNIKKARLADANGGVSIAPHVSFWDRFNKFRPITEEADLDLGHNYDGIRELDNRLPPWWLYGFYITIIYAGVYLYMHHVSHTLPSNLEQYQAQMAQADAEREAYLKKSANNIDETNVKLLTDATNLDAGKQVFQTTCFACHGKLGEGGVGPNLTDNYWLHGGEIKDVFKTIKYGWPDKGMKSWKDDFSPLQIEQIASYVESLHGTNPPNAKAPQGILVTSDGGSKAQPKDSVKTTKG